MDTAVIVVTVAVALAALVAIVAVAVIVGRPTAHVERPSAVLSSAFRRAIGVGLDSGTWESIEEALLEADVGVEATTHIVETLRRASPTEVGRAVEVLKEGLVTEMSARDRSLRLEGDPAVILVVGVNGTGKTTTIAKLANRLLKEDKTVLLAAADTFRAGAMAQLGVWGDRLGVRVVGGQEGGDPASVAYDSVDSARAAGTDVVIIDTAGRLHGQRNLMAELTKIHRVAGGERVDEVLLVLDATLGQNTLVQARQFSAAIPVTGVVLTKMDSTARGGIVVAVERELGVPVKLVGDGEGLDNLQPFDPVRFVDSLLENP